MSDGREAGKLGLVGIALLALVASPAYALSGSAPGIGGHPAGVRLARQIDAAYRSVPWVSTAGTATREGSRFRVRGQQRLRGGLVVEQLLRILTADGNHLVSERVSRGRFDFDRDPPARCWTRTVRARSQWLPKPFFTTAGDRYDAPRRHGRRIVLTVTDREGGESRSIVRARDRHVLSGVGRDPSGIVVRVVLTEPRGAPAIPRLLPAC